MKFTYRTYGTCCQAIDFEINDELIADVTFYGGCNGNLKGIAALIKGMKVDEAIRRLEGITCGGKSTSCPDQLAQALKSIAK